MKSPIILCAYPKVCANMKKRVIIIAVAGLLEAITKDVAMDLKVEQSLEAALAAAKAAGGEHDRDAGGDELEAGHQRGLDQGAVDEEGHEQAEEAEHGGGGPGERQGGLVPRRADAVQQRKHRQHQDHQHREQAVLQHRGVVRVQGAQGLEAIIGIVPANS